MLVSLILYGSRARGDHRLRSDVDLLGIIESGAIHKEVVSRGASFYHYPAQLLMQKSTKGDLFVSHLVKEGKVLHDTLGYFQQICDAFRYAEDYEAVIVEAHSILNFIRHRAPTLERKKVRKRYVWAMRTILIARSAEQKQACFSSAALEQFSGITGLKTVVDSRNTVAIAELLAAGAEIGERYGSAAVAQSWPAERAAQRVYMSRLGGIAGSTVELARGVKVRVRPPASEISLPYE